MKNMMILFLLMASMNIYAMETKTMETKTVSVTIDNIQVARGGQLIVFVFLKPGFPKIHDQALSKYAAMIAYEEVEIDVEVPATGGFALKVLHDEDMDGKVTKNWTGIIPKEGLGFSNGARISFGPPSFTDARIQYTDDLEPVISILY